MTRAAPQAMVFDLDDTLYPEREYVMSGFRAVAIQFASVLGSPDDAVAHMMELFAALDRRRVFNRLAAEHEPTNAEVLAGKMVDAYRSHRPTIVAFEDVERAISRLGASYRLGLITDGRPVGQHNKIDALRLRDRLDHIIVTDDWAVEFRKPHRRAFEEMSRCLDVAPQACLYIGDNPTKDFIAPNELGWRTIQIVRPNALYAHLAPAPGGEPQRTVESLNDVP